MTALVSVQENGYKQRLGRDGLGSLREGECKTGGAKPNSLRWLSSAREGTDVRPLSGKLKHCHQAGRTSD